MKITNPVLTGFHADPSMIRVRDTYYIANSTFEWFPGIRLHESKDMVHWNTLPYPLGAEQLDMRGDPASGGVWAPDLSYADGRFWIVYSDVHIVNGAFKDVVNYLTTAEDIRGPWSKPLRLNGVGFDASLFHDDDGRKYLVQQTWDHREYKHQFHGITLTEFDTATMRLKPETARTIWMGDDVKLVEGPHLYKINGWYYLFCAEGVYEYSRHARSILHTCVHRGEDGEGYPMWNPENHLIKFIPETEWTDPSYHLPHFYEVFAQRADEADRPFWREAAAASRRYLVAACHPQTGMNPEYSNYDGTPHVDERDHWHFYSDVYRTAGNIGLDCLWNGVVPDLCDANARLQRFFLEHDRTCVYAVDGTPVDETVLHPVGFIAATAEGSLAAMHSQEPDALDNAIRWVRLLWDTPIRTGTRRYYDNFLYAFAFLALAGEYRTW